ncbi:MAG: 2-hydroxyacid dehydrogenase [Gammaproteobacteria bacterium]|jgi:lactate dehydrogenase-like 2-hydroxyacid dehydrogenase|nr:2-hydroxyacid dehydrogenase [Gammaproteobacteria bacterium]MDP6732138.1 2-hydroxyacid dehydrogenase [Gammaproteobacteria bacterium]
MPSKQKLLVANKFHRETIIKLDSQFDTHHLWKCSVKEKSELIQMLQGECKAVATGSWECDRIIYNLNSLEFIAAFGVGVDGIDFDVTGKRGIKVSNTPGVLDDAVADIAMALILATMRGIVKADKFVRDGSWTQSLFPASHSLAGKTLGIIGLGRIGHAIVHRAQTFKLNIAYHNRSPKPHPYSYYSSISELAANSDILLNVLPGGDETREIIGKEAFLSLGSDGIFINVGRGSSVDEHALIEALNQGIIAGAGLDVYANEPVVPPSLKGSENVVLLPHIGSGTIETNRDMGNLVIKNLEAFFGGIPLVTEVAQ